FRFKFDVRRKDISLPIGPAGNQRLVAIPLIQAGAIGVGDDAALNVNESYTVTVIRGNSRGARLENAADGSTRFTKPVDNIGNKTIADYAAYAAQFVYDVDIPGCSEHGRVFVG